MRKESNTALVEPLGALAAPVPDFVEADLRRLLREQYGIEGSLSNLVGERDQNVAVRTANGDRYVLKIANAAESPQVTDFQIQALLHLQQQKLGVAVPVIQRTLSGDANTVLERNTRQHIVRLVSFLPGVPLSAISPTPEIAANLGSGLARLGVALKGFVHPGEQQVLLWDMRRALELRSIVEHVGNPKQRDSVLRVLDDFEHRVDNAYPQLRAQVIHNDANPGNVLLDTSHSVSGFIDFGDMLRAPLIVDVAIAASYLRRLKGDALELLLPLVAGYHSITRLETLELEMLYDLIRTRLATTAIILSWRSAERPVDDPYRQAVLQSEDDAQRFLHRLHELGRSAFFDRIQKACLC